MFEKRFVYFAFGEGSPKAPGTSEKMNESTEVKLAEKYMSKVERLKLYGEVGKALSDFNEKPEKTPLAVATAERLKQSVDAARVNEEKYKMDEGAFRNEEAASVHRIYERLMRMAEMDAPTNTVLLHPLTPYPNLEGGKKAAPPAAVAAAPKIAPQQPPEPDKQPPEKPVVLASVAAAPKVAQKQPEPPKQPVVAATPKVIPNKPSEGKPVVASVEPKSPPLPGFEFAGKMNVAGPTAGPEAEARGPKIPIGVKQEAETRLVPGVGETVFADKEGTSWLARRQDGGIDIRLDPKHVPPEYVKQQAENELAKAPDASWGKQANFQDKYGYYWVAVKRPEQSVRIVMESTRMS